MSEIRVVHGDATATNADVLVLKYAQGFYGVGAAVASALESVHPRANMEPRPGKYVLLPTRGTLAANYVLFVGVVPLPAFDYGQIRSFAFLAMQILGSTLPDARRVVLTVHGPGYGLDEREAFLALLAGVRDAVAGGSPSESLTDVTVAELNKGRAQRLTAVLDAVNETLKAPRPRSAKRADERAIDAGTSSSHKPHVFVAMPFSEGEMEDVYGFGIQTPVNSAGYLCERIDHTVFTGDVLQRIKDRIDSAALVVADLTGHNPNVYLEVGYAWGRHKATILLARKDTDLRFDVRGQRCLLYNNITDLSKRLTNELAGIRANGGAA